MRITIYLIMTSLFMVLVFASGYWLGARESPWPTATVNEGDIYYSPEHNKFFQERDGDTYGAFTEFYGSAKTVILDQHLSAEYLSKAIKVGPIDQFEHAELSESGFWKVKED